MSIPLVRHGAIGVTSRIQGVANPRLGFLLPILGSVLAGAATTAATGFVTQAVNRIVNPPPAAPSEEEEAPMEEEAESE